MTSEETEMEWARELAGGRCTDVGVPTPPLAMKVYIVKLTTEEK
jgi:hypothetical protein